MNEPRPRIDLATATDDEIEALGGIACDGGLDEIDEDEVWRWDSA